MDNKSTPILTPILTPITTPITTTTKHSCFNREPLKATLTAQVGYLEFKDTTSDTVLRQPIYKTVPSPFAGAPCTHAQSNHNDPKCNGCRNQTKASPQHNNLPNITPEQPISEGGALPRQANVFINRSTRFKWYKVGETVKVWYPATMKSSEGHEWGFLAFETADDPFLCVRAKDCKVISVL